EAHRSDQGSSGQRGHEILISIVLETIVDRRAIILYSLKYGKVKCRRRIGGAGAGQSPGCLPAPRAGGTGRYAGGAHGRLAPARASNPVPSPSTASVDPLPSRSA